MATQQDAAIAPLPQDTARSSSALNATVGVEGHPSVQVRAAGDPWLLVLIALIAGLVVAGLAVWAVILAIRRNK